MKFWNLIPHIMETRNEFIPFSISHPGEILAAELKERGIRQKDFSAEIGMQPPHLNSLIKGRMDLSEKIAEKLEKALGIPAIEWINMQSKYSYYKRKIEERGKEEAAAAQKEIELRATVNLKAIYDAFCIDFTSASKRLAKLSSFGNISELGGLEMCCGGYFKKSDRCQVDEKNMRTWLFIAKCKAAKQSGADEFGDGAVEDAASRIAGLANSGTLTTEKIHDILAECGIAYLNVPKLEKTPIDAFSTKMEDRCAIVVTYRHNDLDKLAFDVLHELGHISLHLKESGQSFIASDCVDKDRSEKEADAFAEEHLIPSDVWKKIKSQEADSLNPYRVVSAIAENAKRFGISPSIAVSRYKHDTDKYDIPKYRSPKIF